MGRNGVADFPDIRHHRPRPTSAIKPNHVSALFGYPLCRLVGRGRPRRRLGNAQRERRLASGGIQYPIATRRTPILASNSFASLVRAQT